MAKSVPGMKKADAIRDVIKELGGPDRASTKEVVERVRGMGFEKLAGTEVSAYKRTMREGPPKKRGRKPKAMPGSPAEHTMMPDAGNSSNSAPPNTRERDVFHRILEVKALAKKIGGLREVKKIVELLAD